MTRRRTKTRRRTTEKTHWTDQFYKASTIAELKKDNQYLERIKKLLLTVIEFYYPPLKTAVWHIDNQNPPMLVMEIETDVKRLAYTIAKSMFTFLPSLPGGPPPPTRSTIRVKKRKKPLYTFQACWL